MNISNSGQKTSKHSFHDDFSFEDPDFIISLYSGGISAIRDVKVSWSPDTRKIRYGFFRSLPLIARLLLTFGQWDKLQVWYPPEITRAASFYAYHTFSKISKIRTFLEEVKTIFLGDISSKVDIIDNFNFSSKSLLIAYVSSSDEIYHGYVTKIIQLRFATRNFSRLPILFVADTDVLLRNEKVRLTKKLGISHFPPYSQIYRKYSKIFLKNEPIKDTLNLGFQMLAASIDPHGKYYLKNLFTSPKFRQGLWGKFLSKAKKEKKALKTVVALWIDDKRLPFSLDEVI